MVLSLVWISEFLPIPIDYCVGRRPMAWERVAPLSLLRRGGAPMTIDYDTLGRCPNDYVYLGRFPNDYVCLGRCPNDYVYLGRCPNDYVCLGRCPNDYSLDCLSFWVASHCIISCCGSIWIALLLVEVIPLLVAWLSWEYYDCHYLWSIVILSSSSHMLELDWHLVTMLIAYSLDGLNYGFGFEKWAWFWNGKREFGLNEEFGFIENWCWF